MPEEKLLGENSTEERIDDHPERKIYQEMGMGDQSFRRIANSRRKYYHETFAREFIKNGFRYGEDALHRAGYLATTQNCRKVRASQLMKHPDVQRVLREEFQKRRAEKIEGVTWDGNKAKIEIEPGIFVEVDCGEL